MIGEGSKVYGRHPVLELLRSERRDVHRILIAKGTKGPQIEELLRLARTHDIEVVPEERSGLDRLVGHDGHQGVVALCGERRYATLVEILAEAAARGEAPFLVLADGIEDPGNLGNLLRSAEAAGAHGVVVPRRRAVGLTPAVVKTSAGATEHLRIVQETNLAAVAEKLKRDHGVWVVGADASAATAYDRADYPAAVALAVGGEGKGLRSLLRERCDLVVGIPMAGKVRSLNAASAAAVLLFEIARRRRAARA